VIRGFGPGGEALATDLAARGLSWAELGRPGSAQVQLSVWPTGVPAQLQAGMVMMERPNSQIAVGWPGQAY
jgi:hypothetical protein